eukprot:CAMPEP_0197468728 /NCGR_PEP_ID=MMETSP1175-20131217/66236_1 /TAXON_ID=1003142 /ORGANISM="Triceratium dubium, Strain CCMP147" /LENGTH=118 /DNA_ID=CAMNT_0043004843 /DNA_START=38 /DNA_END=391 /DNA_ORIENTATION=+
MTTNYNPVKATEGGEEPAILHAHAEVIPFDGVITSNSNEADLEQQTEESLTSIRVVAPCSLPLGYQLLVKTPDGDSFDVLTPTPVQPGQVFVAKKFQPEAIEGRFSGGLLECLECWFW